MTAFRKLIDNACASLRTFSSGVPVYLLPVVVIGLFLWWFCTIPPPGKSPTLPADWTPGCPQSDGAWQSLAVGPGKERIELADDHITEDSLLLMLGRWPGNGDYLSIDPRTGVALKELKDTPTNTIEARPTVVIEHVRTPSPWPDVRLHDPVTLEVTAEYSLQSDRPVSRQEHMYVRILEEQPDRSLRGILWHVPMAPPRQVGERRTSLKCPTYWFTATEDGTITELMDLDCASCQWETDPTVVPGVAFVRRATASYVHPIAIDLLNGEEVPFPSVIPTKDPPESEPRRRVQPEDVKRLSRVPLGKREFLGGKTKWEIPQIRAELSIPTTFVAEESDTSNNGTASWGTQIARIRQQIWKWHTSPDQLLARAASHIRVDTLVLASHHSSTMDRKLTGDLAATIRHEIATTYRKKLGLSAPLKLSQGAGVSHTQPAALGLPAIGCRVFELPNRSHLVIQALHDLPESECFARDLCRIGIIEEYATDATWLGWIPLTEAGSLLIVTPQMASMEVYRVGNSLMLVQSGLHESSALPQPKIERDFLWLTVPLPSELADLSEGPL